MQLYLFIFFNCFLQTNVFFPPKNRPEEADKTSHDLSALVPLLTHQETKQTGNGLKEPWVIMRNDLSLHRCSF